MASVTAVDSDEIKFVPPPPAFPCCYDRKASHSGSMIVNAIRVVIDTFDCRRRKEWVP